MPRILSTYGGGFVPAAINLHPPLKGSFIAALFATAAIYLQRHCNTDGTARRNRSKGPLAALFWALVAVLDRRSSPFFLQCVFVFRGRIYFCWLELVELFRLYLGASLCTFLFQLLPHWFYLVRLFMIGGVYFVVSCFKVLIDLCL